MARLDRFAAQGLEQLLPEGAAQSVEVNLVGGWIEMNGVKASSKCRVERCRIGWNFAAFLTPLTPFVEVSLHNANCDFADLLEACRGKASHQEENTTTSPNIEREGFHSLIAGLFASVVATVVSWVISIILSDVVVTLSSGTLDALDSGSATATSLRLEVCSTPAILQRRDGTPYDKLVESWRGAEVSIAASAPHVRVQAPVGPSKTMSTIQARGIVCALRFGTMRSTEASVAIASTIASLESAVASSKDEGEEEDKPLLELGNARFKLADSPGGKDGQRLDAEFYDDVNSSKIIEIAAVNRSSKDENDSVTSHLDCRARVLEPLDLRLTSTHLVLLALLFAPDVTETEQEEESFPSTSIHRRLFLEENPTKKTNYDLHLYLKAPVTFAQEGILSATVERNAKISARFSDDFNIRLSANVPIVYAVSQSAAAGLTLESIQLVDETLSIEMLESRVDSAFLQSEEAAYLRDFIDNFVGGDGATAKSPITSRFALCVVTAKMAVDNESFLLIRQVGASLQDSVAKFSCEGLSIGPELVVLKPIEATTTTGAPACEALLSLGTTMTCDVSFGTVAVCVHEEPLVAINDFVLKLLNIGATTAHEAQKRKKTSPTSTSSWKSCKLSVATLSACYGRFVLTASSLEVTTQTANCDSFTLTCSSLLDSHKEMAHCELLRVEQQRATCRLANVTFISEVWNSCATDVLRLTKRFTVFSNSHTGRDAAKSSTPLLLRAESLRIALPVSVSSPRRLILEGSDASYWENRVMLVSPSVVNHEGRVVAHGRRLEAITDFSKLSIDVRFPLLESEKLDVEDYRCLRHAIWRNLSSADDLATTPTEESTTFRLEIHADAVKGTLVDDVSKAVFEVDARKVAVVVDRRPSAPHFFVVNSEAVEIRELAWTSTTRSFRNPLPIFSRSENPGKKPALAFEVGAIKTTLRITGSQILWHTDKTSWWQLKAFFTFNYVRDLERDGPYKQREEERSVIAVQDQEFTFCIELDKSTLSFSISTSANEAIKFTGGGAQYQYSWFSLSPEKSHQSLEMTDSSLFSSPSHVSGSIKSFKHDFTQNQVKLASSTLMAPAFSSVRDAIVVAHATFNCLIDTSFGGRSSSSSSTGCNLDVSNSSIRIGRSEWECTVGTVVLNTASFDGKLCNLNLLDTASASPLFRLEKAEIANGKFGTSGPLSLTSIPLAAMLVRSIGDLLPDMPVQSANPTTARRNLSVDRVEIAATKKLALILERVETDSGSVAVGGLRFEHRGKTVVQTHGKFGGLLDDLRIESMDFRWSKDLETEVLLAQEEIMHALTSVAPLLPAESSSAGTSTLFQIAVEKFAASHGDLDATFAGSVDAVFSTPPFFVSRAQIQIDSAVMSTAPVLVSPIKATFSEIDETRRFDLSRVHARIESHNIARLANFVKHLPVSKENKKFSENAAVESKCSVACRGVHLEFSTLQSDAHEQFRLHLKTDDIIASFMPAEYSLVVANPKILIGDDSDAMLSLQPKTLKGDAVADACVLAARGIVEEGVTFLCGSRPLWMALSDEEIFDQNDKRMARLCIRADPTYIVGVERLLLESVPSSAANRMNGDSPKNGRIPRHLKSCRIGARVTLAPAKKSTPLGTMFSPSSKMITRSPFGPSLGLDEVIAEFDMRIGGSFDAARLDVLSLRAIDRQSLGSDTLFEIRDDAALICVEGTSHSCKITSPSPILASLDRDAIPAIVAAGADTFGAPSVSAMVRCAAKAATVLASPPHLKTISHALDVVATCVDDFCRSRRAMLSQLSSRRRVDSSVSDSATGDSKTSDFPEKYAGSPSIAEPSVPARYKVTFTQAKLGLTLGSGPQQGNRVHVERITQGPVCRFVGCIFDFRNRQEPLRAPLGLYEKTLYCFITNSISQVPGDLLIGVAGSSVASDARCVDVAKRIASSRRPLTLELQRAHPREMVEHDAGKNAALSCGARSEREGDGVENKIETPILSFSTAELVLVLVDYGSDRDWIRLSLDGLHARYSHRDGAMKADVSGLKLEVQRAGGWEPALEPSIISMSTRQNRMELSLSGAKESGDGDCSSLRINASVSIMAEISALIGLVLSHPSSPPGEKSVFHHELRDDFFVGGDLTTRETAVPFLHFTDNDESSLKRAMGLVLSVESFRLSILDGGYDDVSQAESIVLTIKDAVVECSVMNSRYRLNASIEDAQIDSHSKRATFPVMWRARPKRKKLADFIGGPSSSKRMLAVVSATWEHVAESDSECVVVNDLRAELGKIDVYVDESDARDALDLLGRLVEEHSVALRKDIVEARDERRQTSFVLERVEISKIDARLSVRWSSLDDDSFDDEEQSDRAAHAADAHSETPGFGGKQRESLYAESLASSTRGRRLSKESGTTGILPFGSAQSTPQRRSRVIGEDYGTMRSLLEVFAAVERSKITLPSMHIRETMTFDDFMDLLDFARSHYSRGAARNALEIAGSLRAIGNPLGLARGVLRGVEDLVREPVQGLIEGIDDQAPEAFAIGLRRGASSLVRHTVGGTANSLSQITGNFSRAASHLAMDGDYRRRQARKDNRRGNADSTRSKDAALFEGLADGFDSAVGGVVDGVTGLVQAPIRGAERGGAAGAIRGVGQGVLGLVVKPVIGVADAATDVLRGIRDTTDADAAAARAMERTPSAASLAAMSPGVVDRTERAMPHREDAAFGLNESSAAEGRATGQAGSTETLDDGTVIREEFFDQSPARLRPTRALYGSMRWLRPYSLRDARALAALRDACREANGAEPPGIDAFRDRVILYENEGGNGTATLIISDGAVAVVRSNAQPFVVTPLNLLMGCSLDAERCSVIVLVATSLKSFATSPPDRFSLRCSSITVARRACDLLAEAIVRSRDAKQSDTRRLYSANFHKKNGPSPSPSSSVEGRNGNKDR